VGDSTPIRVNARVITATNRNLHELADQGEFREDLLYRLEVVELRLPPLRDRREDIPVLVEHFLGEFNQKLKKEITGISTDVENRLMEYAWPGNVRELEHALEHAAVLCDRNTITFEHLPLHLQGPAPGRAPNPPRGKPSIGPSDIARALEQTAGNKKRAARMLGIDRKTLYRNLAKLKTADSTLPPSRDAAPMNDLGDR
jgi:DNA-binding NtrC family response regulator